MTETINTILAIPNIRSVTVSSSNGDMVLTQDNKEEGEVEIYISVYHLDDLISAMKEIKKSIVSKGASSSLADR
ncbi:MAG: hypothetical protein JAY90_20085 [Candidatus Thiodiazotropha lotti]|nr:hypothetical protein [Candidatus Thiodiazotropha lotti]